MWALALMSPGGSSSWLRTRTRASYCHCRPEPPRSPALTSSGTAGGREGPLGTGTQRAPRGPAPQGWPRAAPGLRGGADALPAPPAPRSPPYAGPRPRSSPSAQRRHGGHRGAAVRARRGPQRQRLQGGSLGDGRDLSPPLRFLRARDRGRACPGPRPGPSSQAPARRPRRQPRPGGAGGRVGSRSCAGARGVCHRLGPSAWLPAGRPGVPVGARARASPALPAPVRSQPAGP